MEEMNEELLERQFERFLENYQFDTSGLAGIIPVVTVIGLILVSLFFFWRWYETKKKAKETNDLISKYYEEYMNTDINMDFQNYVFCREHGIAVRKKKQDNTEARIKTIKRSGIAPQVKEEIRDDSDNE